MSSSSSADNALVASSVIVAHSLTELGSLLAAEVHPTAHIVGEVNDASLGVGVGSERHTDKLNRVRRFLSTQPSLRQVFGYRRRLVNRISKKEMARREFVDTLETYPRLKNLVPLLVGFCGHYSGDVSQHLTLLADLLPKLLEVFVVHFDEDNIGAEDALALLHAYREEELERRRSSRSAEGPKKRGRPRKSATSNANSTALVVVQDDDEDDSMNGDEVDRLNQVLADFGLD